MPENNLLTQSFIGKYADDLGQLISVQIKPIYQSLGIIVPVKSCSIIHTLQAVHQASLMEMANHLQQSHQLVKQKLPRLLKLGLIVAHDDPDDKRRTIYQLTAFGVEQAQLLKQHSLTQVYKDLSQEINADLFQVLSAAIKGLKSKDLLSRFHQYTKKDDNNERSCS